MEPTPVEAAGCADGPGLAWRMHGARSMLAWMRVDRIPLDNKGNVR